MMFDGTELRSNQLCPGAELIIHLPVELRQRLFRLTGRRASTGREPAASGVRRGDEADRPLRHRLLTGAAIEPQLVLDDPAAKVEIVVVEAWSDDRIGIRDPLGSERRRDVVALPRGIFVIGSSAAMKRVAAGLHDRLLCE